jgi:hypothetical protein
MSFHENAGDLKKAFKSGTKSVEKTAKKVGKEIREAFNWEINVKNETDGEIYTALLTVDEMDQFMIGANSALIAATIAMLPISPVTGATGKVLLTGVGSAAGFEAAAVGAQVGGKVAARAATKTGLGVAARTGSKKAATTGVGRGVGVATESTAARIGTGVAERSAIEATETVAQTSSRAALREGVETTTQVGATKAATVSKPERVLGRTLQERVDYNLQQTLVKKGIDKSPAQLAKENPTLYQKMYAEELANLQFGSEATISVAGKQQSVVKPLSSAETSAAQKPVTAIEDATKQAPTAKVEPWKTAQPSSQVPQQSKVMIGESRVITSKQGALTENAEFNAYLTNALRKQWIDSGTDQPYAVWISENKQLLADEQITALRSQFNTLKSAKVSPGQPVEKIEKIELQKISGTKSVKGPLHQEPKRTEILRQIEAEEAGQQAAQTAKASQVEVSPATAIPEAKAPAAQPEPALPYATKIEAPEELVTEVPPSYVPGSDLTGALRKPQPRIAPRAQAAPETIPMPGETVETRALITSSPKQLTAEAKVAAKEQAAATASSPPLPQEEALKAAPPPKFTPEEQAAFYKEYTQLGSTQVKPKPAVKGGELRGSRYKPLPSQRAMEPKIPTPIRPRTTAATPEEVLSPSTMPRAVTETTDAVPEGQIIDEAVTIAPRAEIPAPPPLPEVIPAAPKPPVAVKVPAAPAPKPGGGELVKPSTRQLAEGRTGLRPVQAKPKPEIEESAIVKALRERRAAIADEADEADEPIEAAF